MEQQGDIHLRDLIQVVKPQAKSERCYSRFVFPCGLTWDRSATIPAELRDELLNNIRQFVEQNVEE